MIKDGEGKISDDAKKELETEIEAAKKVLTSENLDELKAANEKLQAASHKIAGEMYQQGAPGADAAAGAQGAGPEAGAGEQPKSDKKDDDVVDADFKEV